MAGKQRSVKDKEMASMLKKLGVKRTSARCPICGAVIGLSGYINHVVYSGCRRRRKSK